MQDVTGSTSFGSLPAGHDRLWGWCAVVAWALAALGLSLAPALAGALDWQSSHQRDHALAGRVWDVGAEAFISPAELHRRLAGSRFVILGEVHINPDHHRLQREILRALVDAGRRPAVVFEMFDLEQQPVVERAREERPHDASHLAEVTDFGAKGWDWTLYRPLVAETLEHDLPLVAGNLSRDSARAVVKDGLGVLGEERLHSLALAEPLEPGVRHQLQDEIVEAHCGHLPRDLAPGMVDAQRARDAVMAEQMARHVERGAVLIAGAGHGRKDVAVPWYLRQRGLSEGIVSLYFVELRPDQLAPMDYVEGRNGPRGGANYDYLWFTAREEPLDPCEHFKDGLKRLSGEKGAASGR